MDVLTRRSRWTRDGTKVAQLSARDLEIFKLLQRYRYLPADFLHAFVGGDVTRFAKRLNDLQREPNCYLRRPEQQRQYFNANYRPLIYELDRRGEQALRDYGAYDDDAAVAWLHRGREGHTQFPHSVMICEALASIELGINADPSLRFIPWSEIQRKMPEKTRHSKLSHCLPVNITHTIDGKTHRSDKALMPDAVFGIEYIGSGVRFFALECDRDHEPIERSNLNQTSYLRKLLQYRDVIAKGTYETHWGLPNLLVLNLTTNDFHKDKIKNLAFELSRGKGTTYLLFGNMSSLGDFARRPEPNGHLLVRAWERAGRGDFYINKANEKER